MYAVIPVAGQRTHGTTFRALKVTSQVATPGAESAVYDCLVLWVETFRVPRAEECGPLGGANHPAYAVPPPAASGTRTVILGIKIGIRVAVQSTHLLVGQLSGHANKQKLQLRLNLR